LIIHLTNKNRNDYHAADKMELTPSNHQYVPEEEFLNSIFDNNIFTDVLPLDNASTKENSVDTESDGDTIMLG